MSTFSNPGSSFSVFPPFIKFLMFANVAIFLATSFFLDGLTWGGQSIGASVMEWFAQWPLDAGFMPWQVISYQYLHGGMSHLFFNMLALWMFGMELENLWGSRRFALYYTLSGIAAGLLHMTIAQLSGNMGGPMIGASGSVMGILLAFGMLFPKRPVMMFPIFFPIPARVFVLMYAGLDLVLGLTSAGDGVAHFAHLGGALGGFLLLKYGEPLMRMVDRPGDLPIYMSTQNVEDDYAEVHTSQRPPAPSPPPSTQPIIHYVPQPKANTPTKFVVDGERITQEYIDEILDKISQGGYHSITEQEKRVLYEVSKQL